MAHYVGMGVEPEAKEIKIDLAGMTPAKKISLYKKLHSEIEKMKAEEVIKAQKDCKEKLSKKALLNGLKEPAMDDAAAKAGNA